MESFFDISQFLFDRFFVVVDGLLFTKQPRFQTDVHNLFRPVLSFLLKVKS